MFKTIIEEMKGCCMNKTYTLEYDNTFEETIKQDERNYTEEFNHENGMYANICTECNNQFIGHKRRIVCKVCAKGWVKVKERNFITV